MHALIIVVVWLALALAPAPAHAQEAEALRRELEQLRRQQEQYQKAIEALSERLKRLESQPAPVATPPGAPAPGGIAQTPAPPAAPSTPSLVDLARPREPFALYGQRGGGQLLFDIGLAGDFVANLTQHNVDKANAGTFAGRENRFFPRGTQLKLGQMRARFGYVNQIHDHDLPWIDRPNALRNFLGDEGLTEKGFEATIVPDLPFYLEGLVGVFDGDNDVAFGYGKLSQPLLTARLRTFVELTDEHAIQLGVSGASGQTPDRLRSQLAAFDVKYKFRPDGWLHPLLTVGGEGIYSVRRVENDLGEKTTRDRFGWYGYAELQPWRRWAVGVRYDWSQFPVDPGREWSVEPYLTYWPSEFLRFRLGYKRTERSQREAFSDNGGSGRLVDELLFQASFVLGAHPAHQF
jgi:hypothetical protein